MAGRNADYDDAASYTSDDRDFDYESHEPILGGAMNKAKAERKSWTSVYKKRLPNRIMRWVCLGLMGSIVVFILILVRAGQNSGKRVMEWGKDKPPPPPTYENFPFLGRYYGGLRSLVSNRSEMVHEYPKAEGEELPAVNRESMHEIPTSNPYSPYPAFESKDFINEYGGAVECFMDEHDTIRVPKMHIFDGLPMGFPEAVYGSYDLLHMNDSICTDRYGRYGPYGYGYTSDRGGTSAGTEGEREGADTVWKNQEQIDYTTINWADVQIRCAEKNAHRFALPDESEIPGGDALRTVIIPRQQDDASSWQQDIDESNDTSLTSSEPAHPSHSSQPPYKAPTSSLTKKIPRQAVLIRTWNDHVYTIEHLMYLRSLIAELALGSGGEYDVHFLIHVKDNSMPIWADDETYERMLNESLPAEFHGMATLWSERQMDYLYGTVTNDHVLTGSGRPVLGVYRGAHLPVQWFAHQHPEYDFFWNWEMDIRYTGNWYDLFSGAGKFAAEQPRKGLWERNHRFYIPSVHGTWEDFKQMVRVQSEMPAQEPNSKWANMGPDGVPIELEPYIQTPVWGPQWPEGDLNARPFDDDPVPPHSYDKDKYEWGVGEEADLITFHPMFDPARTTWTLQDDFAGYNMREDGTNGHKPPRRTAIVAASRLSKRLLDRMHREVAIRKHSMFTEMFPPTMALHHGLKAVYAPHPVFIDREWPVKYLASVFNAGPNGVTGRHKQTIFGDCCQNNMLGVSWHYISGFSPNLWKRWFGLQVNGGGGEQEEMEGEGRMCLPPILFHPIKDIDLPVEKAPEGILVDEHAQEVGGTIPQHD